MGNKYRVKILSPNSKIIFRNKVLRTPVECRNVYEKELSFLKLQIKRNALKFEIINEAELEKEEVKPVIIEKRDKDIQVEELYDSDTEFNSIMERLIAEEKADE